MKKPSSRIFDLAFIAGVFAGLLIGKYIPMSNFEFLAISIAMSALCYLLFRTIWEVNDSRKSDNSNFQYDKKLEDK